MREDAFLVWQKVPWWIRLLFRRNKKFFNVCHGLWRDGYWTSFMEERGRVTGEPKPPWVRGGN